MNSEKNDSLSHNRCCIVGIYFGTLPAYIDLWYESCLHNNDYDFLIVSDSDTIKPAANVSTVHMELSEYIKLAEEKLNMKINIPSAYKVCDFKPVIGIVLDEYLKDYEFWGYCDFDMLFGTIHDFINDDIFEKYDKILPLGHLSLYRNTPECNERYKLSGASYGDYDKVFTINKIYGFDELHGIDLIYKTHNLPLYDSYVIADIACRHKRLRMTYTTGIPNYRYQAFYYEDGKVYRAFVDASDKICTESYAYIHFKRRHMERESFDIAKTKCYFITQHGFVPKEPGIPTLEQIKEVNPFVSELVETYEDYFYRIKCYVLRVIGRIRRYIKNEER